MAIVDELANDPDDKHVPPSVRNSYRFGLVVNIVMVGTVIGVSMVINVISVIMVIIVFNIRMIVMVISLRIVIIVISIIMEIIVVSFIMVIILISILSLDFLHHRCEKDPTGNLDRRSLITHIKQASSHCPHHRLQHRHHQSVPCWLGPNGSSMAGFARLGDNVKIRA